MFAGEPVAVEQDDTRMAGSFELMDFDSGNLVGSYLTLEEALETVRNAFDTYVPVGIDDLGLVRVDEDFSQEYVAAGTELADRVIAGAIPFRASEPASPSHANQEKRRAS